jgi:hypothetical protein
MIHQVHADADRCSARTLRRQTNLRGSLLHAVHVVSELAAIVDGSHVIPRAERMQLRAIDQRFLASRAVDVAVQAPPAVDDADFKQHPIVGICLLQMKPALLRSAAVRAKDSFPREGLGAGERMHIDEQRVVHSVEFDRFACGCVDHARVAEDRGRVAADAIESVERPDLRVLAVTFRALLIGGTWCGD